MRDQVADLAAGPPGWTRDTPVRRVLGALGGRGCLRDRWETADRGLGLTLIDELGRQGLFGPAVAVGLHLEAVTAILGTFGGPSLDHALDGALDGRLVGCLAVSEAHGGSDLAAIRTRAEPIPGGWRVIGAKRFVSLAPSADLVIVLARVEGGRHGCLGAFVLDGAALEVVDTHRLEGGAGLETSAVRIDAVVGAERLLGRPGTGLAVLSHGLTGERLAVAALVCGSCRLALSLAVSRAHVRVQFGAPLIAHQALRLRLADLDARLRAIEAQVDQLASVPRPDPRHVAGLKVTAARFGEACVRECLHVFGGEGYVEGATPLAPLLRDLGVARLGGGSDEVLWEVVAGGLHPDPETYRRWCPTLLAADELRPAPARPPEPDRPPGGTPDAPSP